MGNEAMRVVVAAGVALCVAFAAGSANAQGVVVDPSGNVGIGTSSPATLLEVNAGTSNGQIATFATGGNSVKLGLESSAATWTIANQSSTKFRIREDNSSAIAFELDTSGNLVLAGVAYATTFQTTSARASKTDIVPVDERKILDEMTKLPVFKWRYKSDVSQASQIGPMAEDFRDVFGIGDGTHLSLTAANGLSFAAIKGLNAIVKENYEHLEMLVQTRDREIEELRRANAQFAERLTALEAAAGNHPAAASR